VGSPASVAPFGAADGRYAARFYAGFVRVRYGTLDEPCSGCPILLSVKAKPASKGRPTLP